jgi:5-methylcytosine-specific restriction endonuclease McrA
VTAATLVDHKLPFRRGDGSIDEKLRWSRSNWQSLCTPCHSGDKQRADRSMRLRDRTHNDPG